MAAIDDTDWFVVSGGGGGGGGRRVCFGLDVVVVKPPGLDCFGDVHSFDCRIDFTGGCSPTDVESSLRFSLPILDGESSRILLTLKLRLFFGVVVVVVVVVVIGAATGIFSSGCF